MKNVIVGKLLGSSGKPVHGLNGDAVAKLSSLDLGCGSEPLLSCWEALDGRARLIVSRDGKLIASSEGARRLFSENEWLLVTGTLTLTCNGSSKAEFRKLLGVGPGEVETIIMAKHGNDGHFVISSTGISADSVAVAVRDADGEFTSLFAGLEEVFGLTPSEVLVVGMLMHGHAAQQIADELEISVYTVRAHLRHCYDKLQVSSREELWQRLAPYRVN